MGKIKDLAIQIEENDNDEYMAYMLGITVEELGKLSYIIIGHRIDFTRTLVFEISKCPSDILNKVKNLTNDNSVTYDMIDKY
jgi:hypothetical protein